jgi:hypothetical protein
MNKIFIKINTVHKSSLFLKGLHSKASGNHAERDSCFVN